MPTAPAVVTFGAYRRQLRERAGLTHEQRAERASLTAKAISALLQLSPADAAAHRDARRHRAAAPSFPSSALHSTISSPHERAGPLTPLVGRAGKRTAVKELLGHAQGRLVCWTGPGGVGKTRVALGVATQAAPHFADGVLFVALAVLEMRH